MFYLLDVKIKYFHTVDNHSETWSMYGSVNEEKMQRNIKTTTTPNWKKEQVVCCEIRQIQSKTEYIQLTPTRQSPLPYGSVQTHHESKKVVSTARMRKVLARLLIFFFTV